MNIIKLTIKNYNSLFDSQYSNLSSFNTYLLSSNFSLIVLIKNKQIKY